MHEKCEPVLCCREKSMASYRARFIDELAISYSLSIFCKAQIPLFVPDFVIADSCGVNNYYRLPNYQYE